ncbi:MAG: hypothetical protein PHV18_12645 [Lachnospiraceae bacterium]|nr:hypothetical protein [Lachnospiraceae bacterium]
MKRIMAVYDVDPFYADRFAEFTNQREAIPFTAVAFTSLARLREYAAQQPVELLLIGDEVKDGELEGIATGQIVRLSETGAAGGGTSNGGTPAVYKYQATDSVLREVMACYQVKRPAVFALTGTRSQIIGVYSPIGRCGKTGFALTLGQILARENKVLFVSLEECSGLSRLTASEYGKTLTDLVYDVRQGKYSHLRLGSVVYNWGGLDYVPPVTYAEDLADMSGEELAGILGRIAGEGIYATIVVDFGHFVNGVEQLLALCSVIYAPVKEDVVASAKLKEWKDYLEISGRMELWERVRILKLPRPAMAARRENYLEQLLWGEMGDYVRTLTGKQREGGRHGTKS